MSTEIGLQAEATVAQYLQRQGLKILDRNWRNRWCEIDLVARDRARTIHFVEVKYRKSVNFGSGFDYITPAKTERLRRAGRAWMSLHQQSGDYVIDVAAVSPGEQVEYLPNAVSD